VKHWRLSGLRTLPIICWRYRSPGSWIRLPSHTYYFYPPAPTRSRHGNGTRSMGCWRRYNLRVVTRPYADTIQVSSRRGNSWEMFETKYMSCNDPRIPAAFFFAVNHQKQSAGYLASNKKYVMADSYQIKNCIPCCEIARPLIAVIPGLLDLHPSPSISKLCLRKIDLLGTILSLHTVIGTTVEKNWTLGL